MRGGDLPYQPEEYIDDGNGEAGWHSPVSVSRCEDPPEGDVCHEAGEIGDAHG